MSKVPHSKKHSSGSSAADAASRKRPAASSDAPNRVAPVSKKGTSSAVPAKPSAPVSLPKPHAAKPAAKPAAAAPNKPAGSKPAAAAAKPAAGKPSSGKKAPAPVSSDDDEEEEEDDDDEGIDVDGMSEAELRAFLASMGEGDMEGDLEGDDEDADEDEDGDMIGAEDEDEDEDEDDIDDENLDLEELIDLSAEAAPRHRAAERKRKQAARALAKKQGKPVPAEAVDDEDKEDDDAAVEASFGFFDPCEGDYHAVKAFLRSYIDGDGVDGGAGDALDVNGLADLIAGQAAVGTTVKAEDDVESGPLGFITLLQLGAHRKARCLAQLKEFILENMGSDAARARMTAVWDSPRTALLLQDRMLNLPLEVVPVLHAELAKDLDHARREAKTGGAKAGTDWDVDQVVILARCCEVADNGSLASSSASANGGAGKSKKAEKKAARAAAAAVEGPVDTARLWFVKFEEEYLAQKAVYSRRFPAMRAVPWPGVGKLPSSHLVMVVPRKALAEVAERLQGMFTVNGQEASW